jgi:hypothetical protein
MPLVAESRRLGVAAAQLVGNASRSRTGGRLLTIREETVTP